MERKFVKILLDHGRNKKPTATSKNTEHNRYYEE